MEEKDHHYMLQQHWQFYVLDALTLTCASHTSDPQGLLVNYLQSVVTGQHVVGRMYDYVAGTPYNRRTFLLAAASSLQPLAALGPFSPSDCHNMLALLCPDFPLSVIKNAWAAATELARHQPRQSEDDTTASVAAPAMACSSSRSQQQAGAGDVPQVEPVPLSALLAALAPVMIYERWLLLLRDRCFTQDGTCTSIVALPAAMLAAACELRQQGWPAPCQAAQHDAHSALTGAGAAVGFSTFVRVLCCGHALQAQVRREQATVALATQMAAALQPRTAKRRGSKHLHQSMEQLTVAASGQPASPPPTWIPV